MSIKRLIFLLVFFGLGVQFGFCQKPLEKANQAFNSGEYFLAIDLYKDAYSKVKDEGLKAEVVFKTAECYRLTGDSKQAELWYKKSIAIGYPESVAVLYYADAIKKNARYEDAIVQYKKYQKLVPNDERGKIGEQSCELASKWKEKPTRYVVENMAFFNSKQNDYSVSYTKNDYKSVYFSSSREGATGTEIHGGTGQSFSDIFESKQDRKGAWSIPAPLNETVNSPFDDGTPSLNSKGGDMFFTRCKVDKERVLGCQILYTTKKGAGWGETEVVPIASDTLLVRHPSLSFDELTLYFAANMPGGFGGNDIWMVKRPSKTKPWGEPVNLGGQINTASNEVFPYSSEAGVLYFASDGHPGMGGLDIFKADPQGERKWAVVNLKYPINSPEDDFGVVFEGNKQKGFLTSNRVGGKGGDDIYAFSLPPLKFNLIGIVKDEKTDQILVGVNVKLIGSDGSTNEKATEIDGSFKFELKPSTDYIVETRKPEYLNGKGKETTKNIEDSRDFKMEILMSPIQKPIELPNIMYDLAKWDLRPESMVSLDNLVQILNDNSNITIELGSHTDFRSDDKYNLDLSQKRAQSVVDYLIEKGIEADRLTAKGYGESKPNVVSKKVADKNPFLKEGQILTEQFVTSLTVIDQQEAAHQINRRTEFKVLTTNYVSKKINPNADKFNNFSNGNITPLKTEKDLSKPEIIE